MHERSFVARYGIAVAASAAALALRAALDPWLGDRFPFIFLYPTVALAAWLGGLGPALLVTVVGAAGALLIITPAPPSDPAAARAAHLIGVSIFVVAAVCIGLLGEHARRSTARAARSEREKDQALRDLAASERLYRAAGELIPFGIWVADARGHTTYLSRSFQDMLGFEFRPGSDEWALRIDRTDYEAVVTAWQRTVDARAASFEHEFRITDKLGQTRWVLSRGAALRDEDGGEVTSWVGVHFDVTGRKRAEQEVARLAAIVASSDDAIMSHSPDGVILSFNPGAERIYGYRADEAIGKHLSMLLPDDRADELPDIMERLRRGERIEHYETVRRRKDGSLIDVSVSISPLRDGSGRLVGASKIARDVTDARQAARALRESEERFRTLADSAPVLIWVNGLSGCEFVNRSYAMFVGMSVDELRGRGWERAVHPEDRDRYVGAYRAAFDARATFEAQVRLRAADGQYRWHQSVGHPRVPADGEFLGYVGCSFDIEQIKRSEAALREADRRKDDFLAMLGHELRNPLAPIRNAVEVLGSAENAHEREWARDVIERQVGHLARLVDDLLDVSRITRGKITLRSARVRLADAIRLAVETTRPLAEQREQALDVALPQGQDAAQDLYVHGDEARLAQVFQNLLHNATKFTPRGGHLRLVLERDGSEAVVRVCDDGCGIAPEILGGVFEPFAQADRSLDRADGGLGIGLTLVKTLIEMHGGRVDAHSEGAGRGSEFVVRLPLAAAPAEDGKPVEPEDLARRRHEPRRHEQRMAVQVYAAGSNGDATRRRNGPLRVLVVDDNADSARSMSLLLKLWGHAAEVALDGPAAIERADAFRPQVVLLDIGLPGMSGYDVARELRRRPASRDAIIVAVTGYGQSEDRRRSTDAGFDLHLVKPVDPSAVERLLDEARAAPGGVDAPPGAPEPTGA